MTRDPRIDPRPGDVLERSHGVRWRVVTTLHGRTVTYRVEGMEAEAHTIPLARWHRTLFPLSRLGWAAIHAMSQSPMRDRAGWVRPHHREDLMRAAGIGSRNTWQKVAGKGGELERAGVLVVDLAARSTGRPAHYRLTEVGLGLVLASEPGQDPSEPGVSQVSEPGLSQGTPEGLSSPISSPEREIPHFLDPGPLPEHPGSPGSLPRRDLAHSPDERRLIRALDAFARAWLAEEEDTDDEGEKATAPRDPATPRRADGLRWDEQSHPDFARALAEFRDRQTTRDGATPWERSREAEPAWCMRAFAHAAWRLVRPVKGARPVRDAWGLYVSTLAKIVKARGDVGALGLEHGALLPDPEQVWRAAARELDARYEREDRRERLAMARAAGPERRDDMPHRDLKPPNTIEGQHAARRGALPSSAGAVVGELLGAARPHL